MLNLKKSACDKCKKYKNRVDDVENEHRRNDMFMKMKTYAKKLLFYYNFKLKISLKF